jgi:hypothetical protein
MQRIGPQNWPATQASTRNQRHPPEDRRTKSGRARAKVYARGSTARNIFYKTIETN